MTCPPRQGTNQCDGLFDALGRCKTRVPDEMGVVWRGVAFLLLAMARRAPGLVQPDVADDMTNGDRPGSAASNALNPPPFLAPPPLPSSNQKLLFCSIEV